MTLSLPQVTQSTTGSVSVYNFKSERFVPSQYAIRVRVVEELHHFSQSIFGLILNAVFKLHNPALATKSANPIIK